LEVDVEGIWSAEFFSSLGGSGTGVVVIDCGQLRGGDSNYFYRGTYNLVGSQLQAQLAVMHYAGPLNNIFGPVGRVNLSIEGGASPQWIMCQGYVTENPSMRISIKLRRLSNL
jgi:hypothetical protein